MNIIEKIKKIYPDLTKKQKYIADYLIENPEDICYITLQQLSKNTSSSELTILRFCKKIGCQNFLDLKTQFREYTQNMIKNLSSSEYFIPTKKIKNESDKENLLNNILKTEIKSFIDYSQSLNLEEIVNSCKTIKKSNRIFIFAHDMSKVLAEFLIYRLRLLSFDAVLVDLSDLKNISNIFDTLNERDLAIFFAFPKYYYPLKNISKKIFEKSIPIITITDSNDSPSVEYSDHTLICSTNTKLFHNSFTVPMMLLNLLASYLVIDLVPNSDREVFLESSLS